MTDNTTIDRMSRSLAGTTSRRQALKLLGGSLAGSLALAGGIKAATAQQTNPFVNIAITGTLPGGGTFTGTFDVTRFAVRQGQLVAIGELTGTLTDAAGNVIGTVTDFVIELPVDLDGTTGTCEILTLVLGPLRLELLGLVVDLNQVVLTITAESGPGNLLGNLLCAIAGLLDQGAGVNGLVGLLNRLLRAFG